MCLVSFVGDFYGDKYRPYVEPFQPGAPIPQPQTWIIKGEISREEFEALRKDVQDMKELLLRAKRYDEENGQPDCHMEEKVAILKAVADAFDIDLSEVFGERASG